MAKKLKSLNPIIGTGYKTLSKIKDGEDGNAENFPDTLPKIPRLSYKRLGVSGLEIGWEFEDKIYYTYELYGSTTKGFEASEENLMFQGLASSYFYEAKPGEKWYFKARAKNTHGRYTEFSSELVAHTIKLDNLGEYVEGGSINGALIENATINNAHIKDLHADKITAGVLDADRIGANSITANKIEANAIESGHIKANSINSNHIQANTIQSGHIQTGAITAGSGIIAEGAIGSAQISSVDAGKVNAGTMDTSKVTIQGADGHLRIKGNRLQVFQGVGSQAKERVTLGDVNGNGSIYGLRVRGADGTTILLDENGVKSEGITDGAITNDKISDDANIDGAKLNINSVVNKINEDGTETIQGTKIEVDGTTLNTKLSTITNKQTEDSNKISQAQSQITANTNAIKLKVDEQTYTTDKKDMTSKLEKNTSEISTMKGQIALKVEQTDITNAINNLKIGGKNLLLNSAMISSSNWSSFSGTIVNGYKPNVNAMRIDNSSATSGYVDKLQQEVHNGTTKLLEPSSWYTFSFYVKGSGKLKTHIYPSLIDTSIKGYTDEQECALGGDGNKDWNLTDAWTRHTYTFKTRAEIPATSQNVLFRVYYGNDVYICMPQLEKGNKASDWNIAPEDIDNNTDKKINSAKAEIKVTTDAISQNVSNLSQTVSTKADGSTVTSLSNKVGTLETSVNGISGKVSNLESTTTTLNGKVADAQTTANNAVSKANSAQSTANTANSTANANKSNITNLQGEITTVKSDMASLEVTTNGISQKVSSVESTTSTLTSKVNTVESTANQAKTSAESANNKVDNMSIGGRNLAQSTSSSYSSAFNSFTGTTNTCPSLAKVLTDGLSVGDTVTVKLIYKYKDIVATSGQTASCWIQGSGDVTSWNRGTFAGSPKKTLTGSGEHTFLYSFKITDNHLKNTCWNTNIRHDYVQSGSVQWKMFKVEKGNKATDWTPAPEDVNGAINSVDGKVATLQGTVNTTNSKVATLETNLNGITQRVSSTESTTATLTTKVNTVEGTANTAKSTADTAKSTADSAKSTATSAQNTANSANTNATNALNTANSANSKINNLQIGGRNYALGTQTFISKTGENKENQSVNLYSLNKEFAGNTVTTSFDWEVTGDIISGKFYTQLNASPWAHFSDSITVSSTNKKGRVVCTREVPLDLGSANMIKARLDNFQGIFKISNLKIEIGNKATDWSPAPEDVQSQIDTHTTQITTTNSKVSSIETNLSGITSRVGSVETKTTTLEGKVASQETRISNAESKITDSAIINTVSSTIDNKVSTGIKNVQIGDRNLLLMENVVNRESANFSKDGYTVSFTHGAEWQGIQFLNLRETMELGKEYCLQYKIKKVGGTLNGISHHVDAQFEIIDYLVDGKLQNATAHVGNMGMNDTNWHTCTLRVKRKTDATGSDVNRIIPQPNRGSATSVTVEMKDFKISQGNKFGDWSPAPEDVEKQLSDIETMLNGNIDNAISGTKSEILDDVSKNYANKEIVTQLQETVDSKFEQTSTDISMQFNTAQNYTKEVDGKLQDYQNTVATHIRFSENGIDLGKTNSPFSATLDNTKLAFKQNGEEIAYISNNKMYITQAEVKESLRIGKSGNGFFSWVQGSEGNLSLRWSES